MNFSTRRGTTKSQLKPGKFEKMKRQFLQKIIDTVQMEEIPAELGSNRVEPSSGYIVDNGFEGFSACGNQGD